MATTRKIKEAKDLSSGELIYFKGHAKATYMTDGRTVEDAINNINQSGNGGGSSSGSGAYGLVEHGTTDTTFSLTSNTFHVWGEVISLTLTFSSETSGTANEYLFQFTSGSTATTLTLPDNIKWTDFTIEANKIYQISILNGLGSVLSWDNTPKIKNVCTIVTYEAWGMVEYAIKFEYPVNTDIEFSVIGVDDEIIETGFVYVGTYETTTSILDLNNVKTVMLNPASDDTYIYVYETQVF